MAVPFAWFVAVALDVPQGAAPLGTDDPWFALLPWIEMAGLVALGALLVVALRVLQRFTEIGEMLRAQSATLEQLATHTTRGAAARSDVDVRRLEHLLLDIRDGQAKLADAILVKGGARVSEGPAAAGLDPTEALLERVHDRLYALGYDRVQLLGPRSELADLVTGRGALPVEAQKGGIVHKGRVQVHAGRILDVEMRPPYAMFP